MILLIVHYTQMQINILNEFRVSDVTIVLNLM